MDINHNHGFLLSVISHQYSHLNGGLGKPLLQLGHWLVITHPIVLFGCNYSSMSLIWCWFSVSKQGPWTINNIHPFPISLHWYYLFNFITMFLHRVPTPFGWWNSWTFPGLFQDLILFFKDPPRLKQQLTRINILSQVTDFHCCYINRANNDPMALTKKY